MECPVSSRSVINPACRQAFNGGMDHGVVTQDFSEDVYLIYVSGLCDGLPEIPASSPH